MGKKIKRRIIFCDVTTTWNSSFSAYRSFVGTQLCSLTHSLTQIQLTTAFTLHGRVQGPSVSTETTRPSKLKIFNIWPFTEKWLPISKLANPHNSLVSKGNVPLFWLRINTWSTSGQLDCYHLQSCSLVFTQRVKNVCSHENLHRNVYSGFIPNFQGKRCPSVSK